MPACSASVKPSNGTDSAQRFTSEMPAQVACRAGAGVDPAVLVPGDDDPLDVEPRLVERDLLDEHLDVVAPARRPPLPNAGGPGVIGRQREPRVVEFAQESREETGTELDVERGIVEV